VAPASGREGLPRAESQFLCPAGVALGYTNRDFAVDRERRLYGAPARRPRAGTSVERLLRVLPSDAVSSLLLCPVEGAIGFGDG